MPMKAFGGSLNEVLQLTSNHEPMEQPEPTPTPNGYGTVKFPHFLGQPGFVMVAPAAIEWLFVVTSVVFGCAAGASGSNNKRWNKA